ncbi:hypothetical protein LPJ75_005271 [Coemansia sp. RSA 2598]|nr:hypothetical protein LPJ75_005271 [Coemansia sp. RSA 2598]
MPTAAAKDRTTDRDGSGVGNSARTARGAATGSLVLALSLALRLANVCLVQTFIHPDETWQSLEVAHRAVFGYGYITWEWRHALRGFAHPMLFAAVYRALALLRLDDSPLIVSFARPVCFYA